MPRVDTKRGTIPKVEEALNVAGCGALGFVFDRGRNNGPGLRGMRLPVVPFDRRFCQGRISTTRMCTLVSSDDRQSSSG